MRNGLIVVLAVGLVAAFAVLEGLHSNRWGTTEDVRLAAEKLKGIPIQFGTWQGTELPQDSKAIQVAEAAGTVSRVYQGKKGGRFTVLLLCGPTGPIGAHTPEVCYGGLGYSCKGSPAPRGLKYEGGQASFWAARFEKPSVNDEPLFLYWAWGTDGNWQASANPRTDFALRGALYKLYVVRSDVMSARGPNDREPIEEFLADFLPHVKTALTSPAG
jgi:hypothetical protein